ncbi:MAG: hypothetical protein GY803_25935 [Chloroflexi bacterium]|nr:hypothetical protein [Chloroflexota bacterium]
MSDITPTSNRINETLERPTRSRQVMRRVGALLVVVSVLLGWYLLVGYWGWQNGQETLVEKREVELTVELSRQIILAQENIEQGSYNLALRRLEYVLERNPNDQEVRMLQTQAQTKLDALMGASQAMAAATLTPTPRPLPSPTPGLISDPQEELQRLRRMAANRSWEEALPAVITFQKQFPSYERPDTDRLLYDAYVNYGLALLEGDEAELGLFYLEQAEKLGDLSQEVLDYRLWAELYLQGMAFFDVNWGVTIYYFRELCVSAPFYQSACERLHESLINYGDQYARALDWCPAQELYQEALGHGRSQALVEKINQAGEACLLATPTPSAPITNTLPVTGTDSLPVPTSVTTPASSFVLPTAAPANESSD